MKFPGRIVLRAVRVPGLDLDVPGLAVASVLIEMLAGFDFGRAVEVLT
ncbi:hypothetical protein NIIDMKKI_76730 [Mycobacterium kansasii]|uniref:Uncharacterized protein n=1 Tax=Mycobacterium kansasii TaxID=1768 RepID=A0A7G1INN8_MYCKA|nr:hypothetical protein NIIDMKKI_76730 [Mycobacterium kansasii]